jgi:hypothetical protein
LATIKHGQRKQNEMIKRTGGLEGTGRGGDEDSTTGRILGGGGGGDPAELATRITSPSRRGIFDDDCGGVEEIEVVDCGDFPLSERDIGTLFGGEVPVSYRTQSKRSNNMLQVNN